MLSAMTGIRLEARLRHAVDSMAERLSASCDESDTGLLAGLRAAESDPRAKATCVESLIADAAVRALVLADRWSKRHGPDDPVGAELSVLAEETLASIGKRIPNVRDKAFHDRAIARVASFVDVEYPPQVARIVVERGLEVHEAEFSCQRESTPLELIPAVAGKRRRLLSIYASGSPYAPTAELVGVPSQRCLFAIDSPRESWIEMPWRPAGWCDVPAGESVAFRYTGRIASRQTVATMSVLL